MSERESSIHEAEAALTQAIQNATKEGIDPRTMFVLAEAIKKRQDPEVQRLLNLLEQAFGKAPLVSDSASGDLAEIDSASFDKEQLSEYIKQLGKEFIAEYKAIANRLFESGAVEITGPVKPGSELSIRTGNRSGHGDTFRFGNQGLNFDGRDKYRHRNNIGVSVEIEPGATKFFIFIPARDWTGRESGVIITLIAPTDLGGRIASVLKSFPNEVLNLVAYVSKKCEIDINKDFKLNHNGVGQEIGGLEDFDTTMDGLKLVKLIKKYREEKGRLRQMK